MPFDEGIGLLSPTKDHTSTDREALAAIRDQDLPGTDDLSGWCT
jgi:hypothetical protein